MKLAAPAGFDWHLRRVRAPAAWRYARLAGDRARAKAANVEAAGFYRQALDAALKVPTIPDHEVATLAEALGDTCELAGTYDEGVRAYRTARRATRNERVQLTSLFAKEGRIQERAGRYGHARRLYRHGLRLLVAADYEDAFRVQADLQVLMAGALFYEGRYGAGIWWARRAADVAGHHGNRDVLAHAYYLLDWGYTETGQQGMAKEYRGLALPIYEELGDLVGQVKVLNNLGANAYDEGQWEETMAFYEQGQRAAERAGDVVHSSMLTANIAEVLLHQGHLDKAEQLLRNAVRMAKGAGFRVGEAWSLSNLGLTAARSGRHDEGHGLLMQAREMFREIGADSHALQAGARLAEISLLARDHRNARSLITRTLDQMRARTAIPVLEAVLHRLHGYALLQAGDLDNASSAFDDSLAAAETTSAIYEMALTLEAKSRLARIVGLSDGGAGERSRTLLDDLGVILTPEIPLPSPAEVALEGERGVTA